MEERDSIISNYAREPLNSRRKDRNPVGLQVSSALLALCAGVFVAGGEVFLLPLRWLGWKGETYGTPDNIAHWVALILGAVCVLNAAMGNLRHRFNGVISYLIWFIILGTAFLVGTGPFGINQSGRNLSGSLFLSSIFGIGTTLLIVGPAILILGALINPLRKRLVREVPEPASTGIPMRVVQPSLSSEQDVLLEQS